MLVSFLLTVKTLTSLRFRTSSTRPSGFPLGTGMVPRMVKEEPSSVCRTALMKDWLKSSILPISSMTNTFLLPPSAAATWGGAHVTVIQGQDWSWHGWPFTCSWKYVSNPQGFISCYLSQLSCFSSRDTVLPGLYPTSASLCPCIHWPFECGLYGFISQTSNMCCPSDALIPDPIHPGQDG